MGPVTSGVTPGEISVVIPVKDDAPALDRCLLALRRQTLVPLEVVVVDNASTDASAQVAAAHGAHVVPEPAPGIAAAAATGYDAAVGRLIVRCDADTVPPPDWLERIAAAFVADPSLEALTGSGRFYDVGPWRARLHGGLYLRTYYLAMHAALGHVPLWGSNMAMTASAWHRVSGLVHRTDPEVHDDVDLAFALGPRVAVRYDRTLVVDVSGRSLRGGVDGRRRMARALHTLAVNWRRTPPWRRWAGRRATRIIPASGAASPP